ncbi:hypothetical protein [Caballeronia catudaia]|uniref:hypothetical protein n=1 Tax=Caballeronia catudaia TaxID=1777136 RepID=UPI001F39ABB3|nr:hypothetical protein [Caballeronia catudaia]
MEKNDQLVRLNIGVTPYEANFSDWVVITGDLLYLLIRSSGEMNFLRIPLDFQMLDSIRESAEWSEDGMYRGMFGEPTLLAIYLALVFLDHNVPVAAIQHELRMSDTTMKWLLAVRQCTEGVMDPGGILRLIRLLRFDDGQA